MRNLRSAILLIIIFSLAGCWNQQTCTELELTVSNTDVQNDLIQWVDNNFYEYIDQAAYQRSSGTAPGAFHLVDPIFNWELLKLDESVAQSRVMLNHGKYDVGRGDIFGVTFTERSRVAVVVRVNMAQGWPDNFNVVSERVAVACLAEH